MATTLSSTTSTASSTMQKPSSFSIEFPKNVLLGEIISDQKQLIGLDKDMKLQDAVNVLKQRNLVSAPVFDRHQKCFVGMIDVYDILRWMALGYSLQKAYKDTEFEQMGFEGTLMDIVNQSEKCRRIFIFESNQSLECAMKILSFRDHRVLVCNSIERGWDNGVLLPTINSSEGSFILEKVETNKSYSILTQSDVIQYMFKNKDKLSPSVQQSFSKSLQEIGMIDPTSEGQSMVKIAQGARTWDALLKMFDEGVIAVPVVDDQKGNIIATFSSSDLRGLSQEKLRILGMNVTDFLRAVGSIHKPIICRSTDNLYQIIEKIVPSRIHRVWVVNAAGKPIGVVSLTDIISVAIGIYSDQKTA